MSAVTVKWNQADFQRGLEHLADVKNIGAQKVLEQQARLFNRDVLKMTPPFNSLGAKGVIAQSFNYQRSVGRSAVKRDIYRAFQPLRPWIKKNINLEGMKDKALAWRIFRYIRRREFHKLAEVLRDHGRIRGIIEEPTEQLHNALRDSQGRVMKKEIPWLVTNGNRIKAYIAKKQEHVGKFKAGWVKSADALKNRPPQWITRHQTPGLYRTQFTGPEMFIELGNLSPFGSKSDANIIEAAAENRTRSMKIEAEKIIAAELKKKERMAARSNRF